MAEIGRSCACEMLEARRLLALTPTGLIGAIDGVSFELEGNLNGSPGFGTIPPSPSAAAGPGHVVSAVNSAIQFHTRAGVKTYESNLFAFFQSQAFSGMFDVRVNYLADAGRWVIAALDQTEAPSFFGNRSSIFIAVSDDADPNGDWAIHSINSKLLISGAEHFADGLIVGFDAAGAMYATANLFRFDTKAYGGSRLWIVDLGQLFAGHLAFTLHNPFSATGVPANPGGLAPTRVYAAPGRAAPPVGTFLINAGSFADGSGNDQVAVIRVASPLSPTPTFSASYVGIGGDVDQQATPLPGAPQQGSAVTVRTGDRRVQGPAVWQDGQLFFANTIVPTAGPDAGQATVRWHRLAAPDLVTPPSLLEAENVGGEALAAGTHTFFPAIAADGNGNFVLAFNVASAASFVGAAFVTRVAGVTASPVVYAAGEDFYVRTYVMPSSVSQNNLWGEYGSVAFDETDGTFRLMGQYAGPRGSAYIGEDGRWRTRIAHVGVGTPDRPPAADLSASSDTGASSTDNITADATPTFAGSAEPGASVRLFANGVEIGTGVASPTGDWTITPTTALADGAYTVVVTAANAVGQSVPAAPVALVIDTQAPQLLGSTFTFETGHAVAFTFSESVAASLSPAAFAVVNTGTSLPVPAGDLSVAWDAGGNVATITFPGQPGPPAGILTDGDYAASALSPALTDLAGNALAPSSALSFFVFAGDADRNRVVNISDFSILAARFNQPGGFSEGDFNYSGTVEIGDFAILAARFNTALTLSAARRPNGGAGSPIVPDDEDPSDAGRILDQLPD